MNRQLVLAVSLFPLVLSSNAWAMPQSTEPSAVEIVFTGVQSTTLPKTGDEITIAAFRLTNNTDGPVEYCDHCGAPNLFIQTQGKDGTWNLNMWDWCGMGKRYVSLAKETKYFYIDPEYYRDLYGDYLRFGLIVSTKAAPNVREHPFAGMHWSGPVKLPEIDNPEILPERGYANRKQDLANNVEANSK